MSYVTATLLLIFSLATATLAGPSGTSASFQTSDTSTQGTWQGKYGAAGYSIANRSQSIPSSTSFSLQNAQSYTWASTTADPRALQVAGGAARTAATWYGGPSFSLNLNFTDGNVHQLAIYALDWDGQGRSETIQVLDAVTNATLDTRTISGFGSGIYLVWDISGNVVMTVTAATGPNAVVSGIFFGSSVSTAPAIISANSATFTANSPGTFMVATTGSPTASLSETGSLPAGVSFTNNGNGTGTLSGTPLTNSGSPFNFTFAASNGVSLNATQSFTLTVNPAVVTTGPGASFLNADTSTQGNWVGVYGSDGYALANGPASPAFGQLAYGTYAVQSQLNWTWISNTTDPRALQDGSSRIAPTWYSLTTFSFDVNFTDANTHQIALYLLDWDSKGRGETVQILNAASGVLLDTRTVPSSTSPTASQLIGGTYLVWSVSGHVTILVTLNSGPNAVVSGIFFGSSASGSSPSVSPMITSASNATFTAGASGTFMVTATGTPAASLSETGTLPAGISFTNNGSGTATLSGTPATSAGSPFSINLMASNGVGPNATQALTLTVNPAVVITGPSAAFLTTDATTQGNWVGVYGGDGSSLANGPSSPAYGQLSYGSYAVQNQNNWTWTSITTDPRALQNGAARLAATWYSAPSFGFDVNLTDTNTHQLALYVLDWDNQGRSETIQILNAGTGAVLSSQTVSSFTNGLYLIWSVSGHVKVSVNLAGGANAVVSGLFFSTPGSGGGSGTPASVSLSWTASISSTTVGYNVYRSSVSGSGYAKIGSTSGLTYTDKTVVAGQTYYYVTTAVDSNCNESAFSNQVQQDGP